MHLHPFSLITYFVHEQRAPSFVLTRFLGVDKGKLVFEVGSQQMTIAPSSLESNRYFRIRPQTDLLSCFKKINNNDVKVQMSIYS